MWTVGWCFCKPKDTQSGQVKLMEVSLPLATSGSLSCSDWDALTWSPACSRAVLAHADAFLLKQKQKLTLEGVSKSPENRARTQFLSSLSPSSASLLAMGQKLFAARACCCSPWQDTPEQISLSKGESQALLFKNKTIVNQGYSQHIFMMMSKISHS